MGNPDDPNQQPPNADDGTTEEPTQVVPPQGNPEQPPAAAEQPGYPQPWQGQPWQGQQQWPGGQPWAGQQPYPGQQPFPSQQFPAVPPQQPGYPAAGFGGPPPPGMPPAPGGYPGYPGNPPPPGGDKTRWLIGAGVTVVVIVVAAVVGMWAGGVFGGHSNGSGSLPTASARELVLTEAGFPSIPGGKFRISSNDLGSATPSSTSGDDEIVDPSECKAFTSPGSAQANTADQASSRVVPISTSGPAYRSAVEKATDPTLSTFDQLLTRCSSFTVESGWSDVDHVTTTRLSVDGVNGSYEGVEMTITRTKGYDDPYGNTTMTYHSRILFGQTRGVSFMVGAAGRSQLDASVNADLVKMFNAQRERINNAH